MSEWIDESLFESGALLAVDAMGVGIDSVETARETTDGVEVIAVAVDPEGNELVASHDGGVTFDAVRARMQIPGGQLIDMRSNENG